MDDTIVSLNHELNRAQGGEQAFVYLGGKDGYATPTAIAVGATGASALDKLGLPTGTIEYSRSTSIVSATSCGAFVASASQSRNRATSKPVGAALMRPSSDRRLK